MFWGLWNTCSRFQVTATPGFKTNVDRFFTWFQIHLEMQHLPTSWFSKKFSFSECDAAISNCRECYRATAGVRCRECNVGYTLSTNKQQCLSAFIFDGLICFCFKFLNVDTKKFYKQWSKVALDYYLRSNLEFANIGCLTPCPLVEQTFFDILSGSIHSSEGFFFPNTPMFHMFPGCIKLLTLICPKYSYFPCFRLSRFVPIWNQQVWGLLYTRKQSSLWRMHRRLYLERGWYRMSG